MPALGMVVITTSWPAKDWGYHLSVKHPLKESFLDTWIPEMPGTGMFFFIQTRNAQAWFWPFSSPRSHYPSNYTLGPHVPKALASQRYLLLFLTFSPVYH